MNLIENAEESMHHAMQHILPKNKCSIANIKRGILDLAHVIELLLKERLYRVHPAFIWTNVDKYPSRAAYTVTVDQAIFRLKNIGGINLKDKEISFIKNLKNKRNEIEHFEFHISHAEGAILIGHALSVILRFARNELDLAWDEQHLSIWKWIELRKYTDFYHEHITNVEDRIEREFIDTISCSRCSENTFDIDGQKCLLCGHEEEVMECRECHELFLQSSVDRVYEEAEICCECARKDEAAYNHEKY